MMMKKTLIYIAIILLVSAAVWGTIFAFKCRSFQPEVPQVATLADTNPVNVGEAVLCRTQILLPWFSQVAVTQVNSGKYAVASGKADVNVSDRGVFLRRSDVTVKLMAVEPGVTEDADFSIRVKTPGKAEKEYICKIPGFQISEPSGKNAPALQLADKETVPSGKSYWKHIAAILSVLAAGAIILGAVYFFKLRRKSRELSEWEKAKRDIELLKSDIEQKRITPLNGFIRLTDLVRGYLERRFGLPATRNTTQEFLDNLSSTAEKLIPEPSKPFLKNFLTAADQVKFAKASADTSLLGKAVSDASNLIDSTCPVEEDKNV